jgi:hypothetical protein
MDERMQLDGSSPRLRQLNPQSTSRQRHADQNRVPNGGRTNRIPCKFLLPHPDIDGLELNLLPRWSYAPKLA